jgi:hypothetical protein
MKGNRKNLSGLTRELCELMDELLLLESFDRRFRFLLLGIDKKELDLGVGLREALDGREEMTLLMKCC